MISETDLYDNKFQVNNFDRNHFTVHDDQSNNNNNDSCTHFNDEYNSKDKSYDELDNPQQINGMKSNEIVDPKIEIYQQWDHVIYKHICKTCQNKKYKYISTMFVSTAYTQSHNYYFMSTTISNRFYS